MLEHRPADLVNPYIGTLAHLLKSTVPAVMMPHGMVKSYPVVSRCGDYYCNDTIDGFPLGKALFLPGDGDGFARRIDHATEDCRCYMSRVEMEDRPIAVESTATAHCLAYRLSGASRLRVSVPGGEMALNGRELRMIFSVPSYGKAVRQYVLLRAENPLRVLDSGPETIVLDVAGEKELRAGVSYIDCERARLSLDRETAGRNFDVLAAACADAWDDLIGRVEVEGNTKDRRIAFYTALYRAFGRMTDCAEHGAYFGYDGAVHEGDFFYTNDGIWDTFRCMHPLQLLLDPARQADIMASYNIMYRESGLMPSFPQIGGDAPIMIGFHAAPLFADCLAKGVELDYETAYEGLRKNALEQSMLPWVCNTPATELDRCYYEKGFFPALKKGESETEPCTHPFERRQAVAVTLEHAYDDWCCAQIARHLGHMDDCALFSRRAMNYKNLFNRELGYMAPKDICGRWVEDFDPVWGGGQGGRDYFAEANSATYTWSVFHDIEGLIALMGGPLAASDKLDALFETGLSRGSKYEFLAQFPDATGLMGQFHMGNEPSFHIPYLYNYFGHPWKAQKRLRDLMDIWFTNSPTGICGDEDGGAMSSWFVFSAMGFYPVCPGKPEYAIGTPLFDRAALRLENGRAFAITAQNAGDGLRYIQEARLNGRRLETPFLAHNAIVEGGELRLVMGPRPNKNW